MTNNKRFCDKSWRGLTLTDQQNSSRRLFQNIYRRCLHSNPENLSLFVNIVHNYRTRANLQTQTASTKLQQPKINQRCKTRVVITTFSAKLPKMQQNRNQRKDVMKVWAWASPSTSGNMSSLVEEATASQKKAFPSLAKSLACWGFVSKIVGKATK